MEQEDQKFQRKPGSRLWNGLVLLVAGFLLLADKMGAPIPHWIFTWPMILIVLGLISGIKSRFHNRGALVLIVVGTIFLIDESMPEMSFHNYVVPAILIGLGLIFILKPRSNLPNNKNDWAFKLRPNSNNENKDSSQPVSTGPIPGDDSEVIDINAVFGGVKKNILSKNFKGGEINSFMGGSEINFLQSDIQHPVTLDINNVFGGTKLVVPSNWNVKTEVSTIFGGMEDKRNFGTVIPDPNKTLLLKGMCIFGGIEVSNY